MAETITFTSQQLQQLAQGIVAQSTINPQAERLARAGTEIYLEFSPREITHREPPLLQLPQRIVSLRLRGKTYTDPLEWTQAWRQISSGLLTGRQPLSLAQVRTAQGATLTDTALATPAAVASTQTVTTTTVTAAAPRITIGEVTAGTPARVTVRSRGGDYALDFQLPQGPEGPEGPAPTFSIGTVTTAAEPAVNISGTAPNFVLDFQLKAGPVGAGSGDVSTESLYADPAWITSLAASKVGLGNVTNESKATMFTNPTFTGTVSGISATMVGLGNVTNESKATMFTSPRFTGTATLQQSTEVLNTKTESTGTVVHDFSTGAVWFHSSISSDFTVNFTNVPTTDDRTISLALILAQGATAYIPTAVEIDGAAQTVKWSEGVIPSGTNGYTDIINFILIRSAGSWTVLGSLSTYN